MRGPWSGRHFVRAFILDWFCCLSYSSSVGRRWGRRRGWRHLDRLALRWLESVKRAADSCSNLPCERSQVLRVPLKEMHGCLVLLLRLPRDVLLGISEVLRDIHDDWLSHRRICNNPQFVWDRRQVGLVARKYF